MHKALQQMADEEDVAVHNQASSYRSSQTGRHDSCYKANLVTWYIQELDEDWMFRCRGS